METKNINISKEYLDKIRGFTAIRPDETFRYVPVCYRGLPEDLRAIFTLRPLSGEDSLKMGDLMHGEVSYNSDGTSVVKTYHGAYVSAVARRGIVRWDNFYDADGNIVEYKNNVDNLPRMLLEELVECITNRASMTEEEVLGLK